MKKRLLQVLIVVVSLVFIYSLIKVYSISTTLTKTQNDFTSLQEIVSVESQDSKYQELYETNNDLIGWIRLEGTVLEYPVMYTPSEPEYYLRRNFEKEYSVAGVPFVGEECSIDSSNIIVYSHNMKNGTMFAPLLGYKDKSFWEAHKIINFDTLYEENEYEVIGAFYSRAYDLDEANVFRYYEYTQLESKEKFEEYVENVKKESLYDTGIDVNFGDQLLTLSTCEYSVENGRFVVVAKKVVR